jgi:hypothetical protein
MKKTAAQLFFIGNSYGRILNGRRRQGRQVSVDDLRWLLLLCLWICLVLVSMRHATFTNHSEDKLIRSEAGLPGGYEEKCWNIGMIAIRIPRRKVPWQRRFHASMTQSKPTCVFRICRAQNLHYCRDICLQAHATRGKLYPRSGTLRRA